MRGGARRLEGHGRRNSSCSSYSRGGCGRLLMRRGGCWSPETFPS